MSGSGAGLRGLTSPPLRPALAGAALALTAAIALALPPEVHPETGPALALLIAAGLTILQPCLNPAPVVVGLLLCGVNLASSLAPGRTAAALIRLAAPIGAFILARAIPAAERKPALWAMAGVGGALGLLAIAQRTFLLRLEARRLPPDTPPAVIERLLSGRPFGTHVTPAALAGALVLCLAAVGALAARGAPRRRSALVLGAAALVGLVLTGSIGAVLGVAAGAAVLAAPTFAGWSWRRRAVLAIAALALVAVVVGLRPGGQLSLDRPDNPLRLRAGNWRGAVLIGMEQPVTGVGLGAFGALYGRVRRPADDETIYAHNSWLQGTVEGGLPALALLAAAVWALWRRARCADLSAAERWFLAGVAAFAAHNLLDFTAYLPGVAVPAAVLAGLAFADRGAPAGDAQGAAGAAPRIVPFASRDGGRPAAWAVWIVVGVLALAAALWLGEAAARRALEASAGLAQDGAHARAADAAARAAQRAPWDPVIGVQAGSQLLAAETRANLGHDRSAELAQRLTRLDPESPAPWRLAGDVELAAQRLPAAWLDWRLALARHPSDDRLGGLLERAQSQLTAAGFLKTPLEYGGQTPLPVLFDWARWDACLLLLQVLGAAFVVYRWRRPGGAPAAALALVLVLLASAWGEGGALPGARLGRQLLIAVGVLAAIWPARVETSRGAGSAPRRPLLLLAAPLAWAGLATALAPDRAAAADGLCAMLAAAALVMLSWRLAADLPSWPDVVARVFAAGAALAAALWLLQKVGLALGMAVAAAPVPLRADPIRPAGDFLHPGHLATYVLAAGLAVAGLALDARGPRLAGRCVFAGLLIAVGAMGGARASAPGLAAGGAVLILAAPKGRVRRILIGALALAALVVGIFVGHRFSAADPFALSRVGIWKACLGAIADRPWTGAGPGGFASLARTYAFADPEGLARFAKFFEGPHSDLLGAFCSFGVPGALLLLAALAWFCWSAARRVAAKDEGWPARAGLLAAAAALAAHGLVDDLLAERPAALVAAAICLGAAAGAGSGEARRWRLSRPARIACAAALATVLLAGEAAPWLADLVQRRGDPLLAARLDRRRSGYWVAAARLAPGGPAERLPAGLDRATRAVIDFPSGAEPLQERAEILDAACRGPLAETGTCGQALQAWGQVAAVRPTNAFTLHRRARLAGFIGDFASAARDARAALALEPYFVGARLVLVRALADAGDLDGARAELRTLDAQREQVAGRRPASAYEQTLLSAPPGDLESLRRRLDGAAPPGSRRAEAVR